MYQVKINTSNSSLRAGEVHILTQGNETKCVVIADDVDYVVDKGVAHSFRYKEREEVRFDPYYKKECCPSNCCDDDGNGPDCNASNVSVQVDCDSVAPLKLNDVITYIYTVTNTGLNPLSNISITGANGPLMGAPINLGAGDTDSTTFTSTYTITTADVSNGSVYNAVTVSGYHAECDNTVQADDFLDKEVEDDSVTDPCISLRKFTEDTGPFKVGDVVTYNFEITNCGIQDIINITLEDDTADSIIGMSIPSLASGEVDSTTFQATYTVKPGDNGLITNTATVSAFGINTNEPVSDTNSTNIVVESTQFIPCINLNKTTVEEGPFNVGQVVMYVFEITNCGNEDLVNISIDDDLVLVNGSLPTLAVGETNSSTFTAQYTVTEDDLAGITNTATVSAQGFNSGQATTATDSHTSQVNPPENACIALQKAAVEQGPFEEGDSINYFFSITNCGNSTLTNVIVTDELVNVNGSAITLTPGQTDTATFSATYIVTADDVTAGQIANLAHVNGLSDQGTPVTDMSTVVVATKEKDNICVELVKSSIQPSPVRVGDVIDYTFTVSNCGDVPLTNITINDTIAAVNGGPIDLVPNQSDNATFSANYTVTQANLDTGELSNTATVFATGPNGETASNTSTHTLTVEATPIPDIDIIKYCSPAGPYQEGDIITYSFTVMNTGQVDLTNVTVTDSVVSVNGGAINLAVGETSVDHFIATYTVTAADVVAGNIMNTATVQSETADGIEISNTDEHTAEVVITPTPCLELVKTCSPAGPYVVDQVVTYNFEVINCGNVPLTGVFVTDNNVTVSAEPINLGAGETDTTSFTTDYTVTVDDINAGSINNTAVVLGFYESTPVNASDAHTAATNDDSILCLNVTKMADKDSYELGETITYTYTVENCGNRDLTNVVVTDDLLAVTGSPISLAQGATDSATFSATHIVSAEDVQAGMITNVATATGKAPTGAEVTGSDTETVAIEEFKTPCIALSKSCVILTPYREGDIIDYTFTVTNCGEVDLNNIVISDSLTSVQGTLATLAAGASDSTTFTAQYTVTASDVAAGEVVNTASVTAESAQTDTLTANGSATHTAQTEVDPVKCISLTKTASEAGPLELGDIINYTYTVENCGNIELTDVTVSDDITTVTGGPISLAPGATDSTSFISSHVVSQEDMDAGSVTNTAIASANSSEGTTSDTDSYTANMAEADPCIEIVKTCLNEDPYLGGDVVQYQYTVTNCGNVTVTSVIVTDDKVAVNGDAVTLVPGQSASTFTANYTVTQADVDANSFTNTATATGMTSAGSVSDTDTHTAQAKEPDTPCVEIVKTCSPNGPYQLNDMITYSYIVINCGNVPLADVAVTDDKVTVEGSAISLAVGMSDSTTFTATHIVNSDDVTAGEIINVATVSASFNTSTITNTATHTAIIEEGCTSIPLTGSCTVAPENVVFNRDALKSEVNVKEIACGGIGNACVFEGSIINSLQSVVDNNNVFNIDVPAHDSKSILMLHIFGGELFNTGQPVLQGTTGNALSPSEISNLTASDADIWQQVICIEGDGVEAGTVDIELPDLDPSHPSSFIMYAWTEVTSANCQLTKDALKTAALNEGNGNFSFANTCNALVFMSGRDVGGYMEESADNVICIETICLDGNEPECIESPILTSMADNLYSYVSKEVATNNGGLAANYYPNAGANNVAFFLNENSQSFTDQTIYTAFEFDLEETESYDPYFTTQCVITEPNTTGFCSYPLLFNCNIQATINHTLEDGASVVITPEINGFLDTTQAVTLFNTGSTAINITTPTGGVDSGSTISCGIRFKLDFAGCGGAVSFPEMTATMSTL